MIFNLLYKAKSSGKWVEGYPFIKDGETYMHTLENDKVKIDESTLCKKVCNDYFENDVFQVAGFKWILKFDETMASFQLTREDPKIKFTFYLPLTRLEDAEHLGNIIDTPSLVE